MGPSPQRNLTFRKNGRTFGLAQIGQMLKMLSLGELRDLVGVMKNHGYFQPRVLRGAALRPAGHIIEPGFYGRIGRKTRGCRDASQRSRANRRKP